MSTRSHLVLLGSVVTSALAGVLIPAQAYAAASVTVDACEIGGGTVVTVVPPVYKGPNAHRGKYTCKGGKYNGAEAFIVRPKR